MGAEDHLDPIQKIVRKIVRAYPVPAWSAGQVELFEEMLSDLDLGMLAHAVRDWITTKHERPSIAAVRRAVAEKQLGNLAGDKLFLAPDEAWGFVVRCFGAVGHYRDFPDTHPIVKAAVDRIGWREMCASENQEVVRAQFRKAYEALLERSVSEAASSEGAIALPSTIANEPRRITAKPELKRLK